jgi:hypothetical protein
MGGAHWSRKSGRRRASHMSSQWSRDEELNWTHKCTCRPVSSHIGNHSPLAKLCGIATPAKMDGVVLSTAV